MFNSATPKHVQGNGGITPRILTDAHKSLARPGRKQATATEDFDVHISYVLS
jgi:hypothetical protein